jgi:hypothetical protein
LILDLAELENGPDSHHMGDNLNPDVPEFIPVTVRIQDGSGDHNSAETEKCEEGQQWCEIADTNHRGM